MPIHDRPNRRTPSRARLLALAPLTCLLFAAPLQGGERVGGLAAAEQRRRASNVAEAQELLKKGDEAYQAGKWKDAAAAYSGARELIPDAPATRELRSTATQRFAQASVERAREQSRHGDVAGAKVTVDQVLLDSVAPENPGALQMRAQLDDPIRTNPALTKEHAADVEEVRLLLYKADGAYNSGQFDQAERVYQDVLRTDPTNTAARRGMERTTQARTAYYRAAGDHTRAELLAQVDGAWELQVPPTLEDVPAIGIGGGESSAAKSRIYIGHKLDSIVLPSIDFDGVTLSEAIDFLRAQSIQLDVLELDESRRGINFVIEFGADPAKAAALRSQKITLQLRNVPLSQVLKHLGEMTHTTYSAQEWAVTLRPQGVDSGEMTSRTFTVPPDFLSVGNGAASSASTAGDDPFANKKPEGLIARKMSAEEVLKSKGVPFPPGSLASFNPGNSSLRVVNTPTNLSLIEQVVDAMSSTAPAMVVVEVKIIRTQERRLKELDFDWLLSPYSLGGQSLVPGIGAGFLSGGTRDPSNLSDIILPDGMDHADAITSGNRSGAEAISGNSLDDLLQRSTGNPVSSARAPGILSVTSLMNDTGLKAVMRGLDQKKGVSLQACPTTVTRSGEQGVIEISRELIYPTEYEPPELPNSLGGTDQNGDDVAPPPITPVTPSHPGSFKMRNVGIRLEVLPTVDANRNYVDLALKPVVTDFDGFVNFGTPITGQAPGTNLLGIGGQNNLSVITPNDILMPVFSVMRVETTSLTLQNGATMVMGGLLQDRIQKVEDHTPILGDIPLVGRLFRSEAYAPVSTAIVFLVTVRIVDPGGRPYTATGN